MTIIVYKRKFMKIMQEIELAATANRINMLIDLDDTYMTLTILTNFEKVTINSKSFTMLFLTRSPMQFGVSVFCSF